MERRALLKEHKKVQRELVRRGKKPFHIKKCKELVCSHIRVW